MRLRTFSTLGCGFAMAVMVLACSHDWEKLDPTLSGSTGGPGTGGQGTGGTDTGGSGTGGTGTGSTGTGGAGTGGAGTGGAGTGGMGTGGSTGGGGSGPTCTGDIFECLADGSAHTCANGDWVDLGPCPLGCDAAAKSCRVPSNVAPAQLAAGTGMFVLAGGGETIVDTDTGQISRGSTVLRPPGMGLDAGSGIAFAVVAQGASQPSLGVFSMGGISVPASTTLRGKGSNALVLLVGGDVLVDGLVTVAATDNAAGPGGYAGGAPNAAGGGACGGHVGAGTQGSHGCTSGGGGAGHPAQGGAGGPSTCGAPDNHVGGLAGSGACGTPELVPLIGGSGGAGGTVIANFGSNPGAGGGGGGALQISAAAKITVSATGRIDAGGGGGGQTITGGGAGGGAGGAILLEAPTVTVATGAILAANGGGGGGGDCT